MGFASETERITAVFIQQLDGLPGFPGEWKAVLGVTDWSQAAGSSGGSETCKSPQEKGER